MKDLFLVAWTGGYEAPQYEVKATDTRAWALAEDWASQMREDGDRIEVLRINGNDLSIELLGSPVATA